jgi:hypothetical protein
VENNLEYYTSERFIHDDLAKRAAAIAEEVRRVWRRDRALERVAISWPSETVRDDKGVGVTHVVTMPIPKEFTDQQTTEALKRMVARTRAYGIALIERHQDTLRVLFETHQGARAW